MATAAVKSVMEQVAVDEDKAKGGVWIPLQSVEGFEALVRRGDNLEARRASNRLWRPYRRQADRGAIDPEVADRITRQVTADHIFLDFRGEAAVDTDGQPLENTRENRLMLLELSTELFEEIAGAAQDLNNFRQDELEEEAGN